MENDGAIFTGILKPQGENIVDDITTKIGNSLDEQNKLLSQVKGMWPDPMKAYSAEGRVKAKPAIMRRDFIALYSREWKNAPATVKAGGEKSHDQMLDELNKKYQVFDDEKGFNDYVITNKTGQKLQGINDYSQSIKEIKEYIEKWEQDHSDINFIREKIGLAPMPIEVDENCYKALRDMDILEEWARAQSRNGINSIIYKVQDFIDVATKKEAQIAMFKHNFMTMFYRTRNLGQRPEALIVNKDGYETINPALPLWDRERDRILLEITQHKQEATVHKCEEEVANFASLEKVLQGGNKTSAIDALMDKTLV